MSASYADYYNNKQSSNDFFVAPNSLYGNNGGPRFTGGAMGTSGLDLLRGNMGGSLTPGQPVPSPWNGNLSTRPTRPTRPYQPLVDQPLAGQQAAQPANPFDELMQMLIGQMRRQMVGAGGRPVDMPATRPTQPARPVMINY